jgi:RNA polymerase sigma-70 factor (ECF subfamily)
MAIEAGTHGDTPDNITLLLHQLEHNSGEAEARLLDLFYGTLRQIAGNLFRTERAGHTLQPTALVHEAYLRLSEGSVTNWQNRAHFYAAASRLMRNILVDHARSKQAAKRGGPQVQVTLDGGLLAATDRSVEILALHDALERLTAIDTRRGRIVELRFFAGLSFEEIGFLLGTSDRTAKRDWTMAQAWLRRRLSS